jgi:hypothetical protein
MSNVKVNIYTPAGLYVGYFLNPKVDAFPDADYEISGQFFDENGKLVSKMEFNPQALPYVADVSEVQGLAHRKLGNVYLQRGRQPVRMTGSGLG